jgi:uncharacterized SAM-binding protein YcdF (DUF218 family)
MNQLHQRKSEQGGIITNLVALLFVVALCTVVYLARRPIMRFAAESWIVNEPVAHADAILVLGDDNFYADRATEAAQLFRQGVAPGVVASGRRLRPSAGVSELIAHDLIERGVPKDRIERFAHDADNTREEAVALGRLATERAWKRVVVVTSNYHTRRARYIFIKVFPSGVTVSVTSARDGDFDPEHWWERRKSVKDFLGELVGMVDAIWELRNQGEKSDKSARLNTLTSKTVDHNGTKVRKKVPLLFTSHKCCNMFRFLSRGIPPAQQCDFEDLQPGRGVSLAAGRGQEVKVFF